METNRSSIKESSDLPSEDVWKELKNTLSSRNKDDLAYYMFEPFPIQLPDVIQTEKPIIPNGVVVEEVIDPELSFQHFIGKHCSPGAWPVKRKPRTSETIHGWSRIATESFSDRLARIKREIPEVLNVIKEFNTSEKLFSNIQQPITIISDGTKELFGQYRDLGKQIDILRELSTPCDSQDYLHCLESDHSLTETRLSMSHILHHLPNNLLDDASKTQHKKEKDTSVPPFIQMTLINPLLIKQLNDDIYSKKMTHLEHRLQYLLSHVSYQSADTQTDSSRNSIRSLKDIVGELLLFSEHMLTETAVQQTPFNECSLESELRVMQHNLDSLDVSTGQSDIRRSVPSSITHLKYFAKYVEAWNPEKRLEHIVSTLSKEQMVQWSQLATYLYTVLKHQGYVHVSAAKALHHLKQEESQQSELHTVLQTIQQHISELKTTVIQHQSILQDCQQWLKQ